MRLYCVCDCVLTQKVPDNTCRTCRDDDDDEEDEANPPFREAPPFMGRIRISARFLCINTKHTNIHTFFSNNFSVLAVQRVCVCYLRETRLSHSVGVAVLIRIRCEPVPELHHRPNRYLGFIFGSVSPDSAGSSPGLRIHTCSVLHTCSEGNACVCQSEVRCGSIVK